MQDAIKSLNLDETGTNSSEKETCRNSYKNALNIQKIRIVQQRNYNKENKHQQSIRQQIYICMFGNSF